MAATSASSNSSPRHYTPIPPPRQAPPKAESSYGKTETTTTTSRSRSSDNANRYLGSFLILLAEFFACAMHVIIRYLQISLPAERRLHAMHLTFIRSFPIVVFCLGYGWGWRRIESMPLGRRDVRGRLRARALGGCVAIMCSFTALKTLPLPDATVISSLTPTFVAIACSRIPALREPFSAVEKLSTLLSLVGVVLIAQPTAIFGPVQSSPSSSPPPPSADRIFAVSLQLLGVFGAATSCTTIRWIGPRAHPLIPMLYFSGLASVGSAAAIALVPGVPAMPMPRGWLEWALVAGLAFTGLVVQLAFTKGLQLEKAGRGLQMMYVQLVFAALFEWAVWGNVMKGWRAFGAVVVLASVGGVQWWKRPGKGGGDEEKGGLLAAAVAGECDE